MLKSLSLSVIIFSTTGSANPFIKLNESEGLVRPRRSYQGIQKKKSR